MRKVKCGMWLGLAALAALAIQGCNSGGSSSTDGGGENKGGTVAGNKDLAGDLQLDGSSTVFPVMQVAAEEFQGVSPKVKITVSEAGTSGGFKKFLNGEIDICNASRPIATEELAKAKEAGIEFIEIPIAFDGLTIITSKNNDLIDSMTVADLKKIWEPTSTVMTWKDVNPAWPAEKVKLFGAGPDSGTFDYFTEAIVGEKKSQRKDYNGSENDNETIAGVSGEKYSLGYLGYAYYIQNTDKLKAVKIDNGAGPIEPTPESIMDGTYAPLSRPLIFYVNKKAMDRPEVKAFVEFVLEKATDLVKESGYVPLPQSVYDHAKTIVKDMKTGSRLQGSIVGKSMDEIIKMESAN